MASPINKKELLHLAKLARLNLTEKEESKLLDDLREILGYIEKLNELDTSEVTPMNGGSDLQNIFRDDNNQKDTLRGQGRESFPETKDDSLSVPEVLKRHD
ncbi:MAG: Asp-tRNA(Asn)/Glu-tRNA(Gln) amidotransferase subunit GatC [Anaplasmataceae bacterium]|nr:Asp-tRNA(Asn)/Glu-tRNA(Gln) amidotransferase subunit GatC [Anaplasmataceae bacterium]